MAGNVVRVATQVTGTAKASSDLDRLRDKFERLQKQGAKGFAIGVGAGVTTKALGLLGQAIGGVTDVLGDAVNAAVEEESSVALLGAALQANIKDWDGNTAAIEKVLTARMALGFSDDQQRESLRLLVAVTHDATKALAIQRIAMDLARFKGIDLAAATLALVKVENGQFTGLKRLGIALKEGATSTEALAAVQRVAAGQAETYANINKGKLEVSQVKLGETMERLGGIIMPVVVEAMGKAADVALTVADAVVSLEKDVDDLGDKVAKLADAAGANQSIWDVITDNWGKAGREADALADMADHAAETFQRHMFPALRDTSDALDDVADKADDVQVSWEDLVSSFEAGANRLAGVASSAADAIYDPLIRKAELAANLREVEEQRAIIASKKSTAEQIADAKARIVELAKARLELIAVMVGSGEASATQITTLNDTLRRELLTATDDEKAAIMGLLELLDRLAAKGRAAGKALRFTSGGNLSVGGGFEVRQHGGPAIAGRPIIVGEKRPELVVPNVSGTILPSVPTTSAGAISGSDAAARWLPIIAAQLARLTAQEPAAARPQTARGDLARQTALMPGGRL